MDKELVFENNVLSIKRNQIKEEIKHKEESLNALEQKRIAVSKESKGAYSQEKVVTDEVYNIVKKDVEGAEDALKQPYFGRVDFREYRGMEESIYIGKYGISSSRDGEEIVVDWRAPVADLYYSGTGGYAYYSAPKGIIEGELSLKRKFLYDEEELERLFDEGLNELMINGEEGQELVDEFLKINLEESRGKKLKEVVATIQKEQNEIIRWPRNLPIIVQGSAGSGKTTIALHRLAYLIYRYSATIKGEEILVLAPNKLFLDYISDILPGLGVGEVKQNTFEELVKEKLKLKGKMYTKDNKLAEIIECEDENKKKFIINSAKIKGTLIFKTIIDRYITLLESRGLDIKDIEICDEILFSKKEIMRLYLKDLKSYPINKRKDEIKRYLSLKLKEKIQSLVIKVDMQWELKIREVKKEMEDSEERRKILIDLYNKRDEIKSYITSNSKKVINNYFKEWRGIDSKDVYMNFLNDEELFEIATDGVIPTELAEYIRVEYNENLDKKIIDEDDLAPLFYIRMLLEGVEEKEKFKHIVVDEVQDYSPFQIHLINQMCLGNSLTLVGDIAQGVYYYKGLKKWEDITEKLFKGDATYIQLTQSYRSTVEIIDFAKGALESQNLGLKNAKPVLRHGEKPKVIETNSDNVVCEIDDIIKNIKNKGKNSVAIIVKNIAEGKEVEKLLKKKSQNKFKLIVGNEKEVENDLLIIPSYLTKGLEFDVTIIYDPNTNKYCDNILDMRLLYVSLTRALHEEYILKIDEITNLIY
ncbi:MAG: RNA polymerase recycling motor HelD [Clostridium sp.]